MLGSLLFGACMSASDEQSSGASRPSASPQEGSTGSAAAAWVDPLVKHNWMQLQGGAIDIGVGGKSAARPIPWVIGNDGDHSLWKFGWSSGGWNGKGYSAKAIDVAADGTPWFVDNNNLVHTLGTDGGFLTYRGAAARDVGAGAGGTTWIIGTSLVSGSTDYEIYRFVTNGWVKAAGGGVRIDVDNNGNPWICNSIGDVYQGNPTGTTWGRKGGIVAKDISVGAYAGQAVVYAISNEPDGNDFQVYRYYNSKWEPVNASGVRISTDYNGYPWVVTASGIVKAAVY